jgi:hypothetical protein
MVGRLVQQQQVRLLRQQTGQVRAHHPAAAHLARGPVGILFAEAEAGEDLLGLGFETIAAQFIEPVVHVVMDVLRVQASLGWSASQALRMRRSLMYSGVMAVASSMTVSSATGAFSCGR